MSDVFIRVNGVPHTKEEYEAYKEQRRQSFLDKLKRKEEEKEAKAKARREMLRKEREAISEEKRLIKEAKMAEERKKKEAEQLEREAGYQRAREAKQLEREARYQKAREEKQKAMLEESKKKQLALMEESKKKLIVRMVGAYNTQTDALSIPGASRKEVLEYVIPEIVGQLVISEVGLLTTTCTSVETLETIIGSIEALKERIKLMEVD